MHVLFLQVNYLLNLKRLYKLFNIPSALFLSVSLSLWSF